MVRVYIRGLGVNVTYVRYIREMERTRRHKTWLQKYKTWFLGVALCPLSLSCYWKGPSLIPLLSVAVVTAGKKFVIDGVVGPFPSYWYLVFFVVLILTLMLFSPFLLFMPLWFWYDCKFIFSDVHLAVLKWHGLPLCHLYCSRVLDQRLF